LQLGDGGLISTHLTYEVIKAQVKQLAQGHRISESHIEISTLEFLKPRVNLTDPRAHIYSHANILPINFPECQTLGRATQMKEAMIFFLQGLFI
jgi:hypothetical protein